TATGDRGNFGILPLNAVRWLTKPRQIAALVTKRGEDYFEAELFHFGEESRSMGAELYLLKSGNYKFTLTGDNGEIITAAKPFKVNGPRTRIAFALPARKRCVLRVTAE
ncbi:MAG: hypothetical protein JXM70_16520, partial [Pirellulales bacterium]|nr:hypothetical protein [Pirellulales bacterium]